MDGRTHAVNPCVYTRSLARGSHPHSPHPPITTDDVAASDHRRRRGRFGLGTGPAKHPSFLRCTDRVDPSFPHARGSPQIGIQAGALVGFLSSRLLCKQGLQKRLADMPPRTRLQLQALRASISDSVSGVVVASMLRIMPILAFGLCNAFLAVATDLSLPSYHLSTLLGSIPDTAVLTYIGILVHKAGGYDAENEVPATPARPCPSATRARHPPCTH